MLNAAADGVLHANSALWEIGVQEWTEAIACSAEPKHRGRRGHHEDGGPWAVLGHHPGGCAVSRHHQYEAERHVGAAAASGSCYCFCGPRGPGGKIPDEGVQLSAVDPLLGAAQDPGSSCNCEVRAAPIGRLGRENHRIHAVKRGVGHISRLGAGRHYRRDHAQEHLSRHHDRLAGDRSLGADHLLDDGYPLARDLEAEPRPRNYHGIRCPKNRVKVADSGRILNLCSNLHTVAAHPSPELPADNLHILC
mmetsp:Transcript_19515/g.46606  ORF Transcript_19515/g.46606 Transcript_19515/m.46606 type:complete len:250 (-) Transcript_19515:2687-3436(-)